MSRFALLSVSDKNGLVPFARRLHEAGLTLLSTGGTASALREAGLPVVAVSEHTGAPEMMEGRVKTLHPRVHGGILGDRERHAADAARHELAWIDVVVCNLYPFEARIGAHSSLEEAIETIDIGGPTMVRAAAKNHRWVSVVVDPEDYDRVADALVAGEVPAALRGQLAVKAFQHTARYDALVADWLAKRHEAPAFPAEQALPARRAQNLRYGENPQQAAAFYVDGARGGRSLARMRQHQGKELSFNNIGDLDAATRAVFEHAGCAAVIVKHMTPCGGATAPDGVRAFERALAGDPVSAFGGILAFNRPIGPDVVRAIKQSKVFFEVIVAPGFEADALERLSTRPNLRVIELPSDWASGKPPGFDARRVQGGWLMQDWDLGGEPAWRCVSARGPTEAEERALRFAWAGVRSVRSNGIVLARALEDGETLNGVGGGQTSRVEAVHLALRHATLPIPGSVLASDAFFPFADGLQAAAEAGVTAVVQPGGSVRDDEVIAAADAAGIAMIFTDVRHFRH